MLVIKIMIKDIKQIIRSRRSFIMGLLFPIVLMVVLGSALTKAFDNSSSFTNIKVIYINDGQGSMNSAFADFQKTVSKIDISFMEAKDKDNAIEDVKKGKYACFIEVKNNNIQVYNSEIDSIKASIVEASIKSFFQRYDAVSSIAMINPKAAEKAAANNNMELTENTVLGSTAKPRALDYYAVTMLTLTIMYSVMSSMRAISGERVLGTSKRMLCSPIRKGEILIGKILAHVIFVMLQTIVLIGFSKYVLKANWGNELGMILLIALALAIMCTCMGIGMSFIIKNEGSLRQLLNMLVTVLLFFGGAYFPVGNSNGVFGLLTKLSPVKWVNDAMFQVIFCNDSSLVANAVIMCLGISVFFFGITAISFRKEVL